MRRWLRLLILAIVFLAPTPVSLQADLPRPSVRTITLGQSSEGRVITAVRIGDGPRKVVLVGNTHGGPEANTYRLMLDVIAHFTEHPDEVPSSVRLYLIPTLNPDGLADGTRFDAHGVDLNRNMDTGLDACSENDWRTQVNGAYGVVSNTGGNAPETQVESRLIRDFLLDASTAIFYHSAGGELFPPYCEHAPSIKIAQVYAQTAGYNYTRRYPRYLITGGMHDWAGSMGIASFTPELWNGTDSDTAANLTAIHTVLAQANELFPLPEDHIEANVRVPAVFWRYWRSHDGTARFGVPLAAPTQQQGQQIQYFERALFELHPDAADTPALVQLAPLGAQAFAASTRQHSVVQQPALVARFAQALEDIGGTAAYGEPLSPLLDDISLSDGTPRIVQYFQRARLEYDPTQPEQEVQLSPLGWQALLRQRMDKAVSPYQMR